MIYIMNGIDKSIQDLKNKTIPGGPTPLMWTLS